MTRPAGLRGERVLLRAPRDSDAGPLHPIHTADVPAAMLTYGRPWVPERLESSIARHTRRMREPPDDTRVWFVIADPDDTAALGDVMLRDIDPHNRHGEIGIALTEAARGRRLGRDAIHVICRYAFRLRGLHRVQYQASAPNIASVRAALAAGFRREALLRQAEWVHGGFTDTVVLGLLADEWPAATSPAPAAPAVPTTPANPTVADPDARSGGDARSQLAAGGIILRERLRGDLPSLWTTASDVDTWLLTQDGPYLPVPLERWVRAFEDELPEKPGTGSVGFTVADRDGGGPVGSTLLWGVDSFHRNAHVGITLAPEARGHGRGTDVLRAMCRYAFDVRGLHRIEIETLADNAAMRGAARRAGFVEEGARREHAWVDGRFHDTVVAGVLAPDWRTTRP